MERPTYRLDDVRAESAEPRILAGYRNRKVEENYRADGSDCVLNPCIIQKRESGSDNDDRCPESIKDECQELLGGGGTCSCETDPETRGNCEWNDS